VIFEYNTDEKISLFVFTDVQLHLLLLSEVPRRAIPEFPAFVAIHQIHSVLSNAF